MHDQAGMVVPVEESWETNTENMSQENQKKVIDKCNKDIKGEEIPSRFVSIDPGSLKVLGRKTTICPTWDDK